MPGEFNDDITLLQTSDRRWPTFNDTTKKEALKAYQRFLDLYAAKYPKACECLRKDEDVLFTFYDFPAEHWAHLRTTNPIESTFATIRLRTAKTRGCLSRNTALTMVFKLALCDQSNGDA